MNSLTKTQITNLVLNAYGFIDRNSVLFMCDSELVEFNSFKLQSAEGDYLEFSYDNAKLINGTATFETLDGDTESFTVVVVAVDSLNITADLLG